MQTTLDMLKPGDEAVVVQVQGAAENVERLMEMGLIAGTSVRVVKYAPLGDPIQVLVRGYNLTLRRAEAAGVVVEA